MQYETEKLDSTGCEVDDRHAVQMGECRSTWLSAVRQYVRAHRRQCGERETEKLGPTGCDLDDRHPVHMASAAARG